MNMQHFNAAKIKRKKKGKKCHSDEEDERNQEQHC